MPPFTTSIWFAHNLTSRAIDPHTITTLYAGGWLTSTYAGPVLLDFGLGAAIVFGVLFGAAAQLLYRRFTEGRSITIIWVYAYLAGPIFMAFYINIFLYFFFPILDTTALIVLSRFLIQTPAASEPASAR
jgi:oligosaccharide repeat unit polymerase